VLKEAEWCLGQAARWTALHHRREKKTKKASLRKLSPDRNNPCFPKEKRKETRTTIVKTLVGRIEDVTRKKKTCLPRFTNEPKTGTPNRPPQNLGAAAKKQRRGNLRGDEPHFERESERCPKKRRGNEESKQFMGRKGTVGKKKKTGGVNRSQWVMAL